MAWSTPACAKWIVGVQYAANIPSASRNLALGKNSSSKACENGTAVSMDICRISGWIQVLKPFAEVHHASALYNGIAHVNPRIGDSKAEPKQVLSPCNNP